MSSDEMSHEEESAAEENVEHIEKKKRYTVSYSRCRKPFPSTDKCSAKSLRTIPANVVEKINAKFKCSPALTVYDRICFKCRQKLYQECESSESSQSLSENLGQQSSENMPDICEAVSELIEDEENMTDVSVDKLKLFTDLLENIKRKYHDKETSKCEKMQILTLLPLSWSYKDIKDHFNVSNYMIGASKKLQAEAGPLSKPSLKSGYVISDQMKNLVIEFYKSEDNVYILPGKKDCVRTKDNQGNVIYEQKRLVLCSLKELYKLFCIEYESQLSISIGFSTFAKLKPNCCILAGSSGTHSVCVCSIHQNVKLIISGCTLENITQNYDHKFNNYKDILNFIICEENVSEELSKCYFGECEKCPGIQRLEAYLTKIFEEREIEEFNYHQWISTPKTVLKSIIESTSDFVSSFCEKIERLLPHAFISKQQSDYFKQLKQDLQAEEIIVCLDFAENYAFVVQNAPPGFHWNNDQSTVFVFYIYYKDFQNALKGRGFVIISDNLSHDTVAVNTYQRLLIQYLKQRFSNIKKIHYFSDGAPQQFKNYKNVLNLYYHEEDFNIKADWHFFPTAHGKGACDGVGGAVKRNAAKASLVLPANEQILTPHALYQWSKDHGNYTNVDFEYSPVSEYNKNLRHLNKRYRNVNRIKDLQKQHFLSSLNNGKMRSKVYSSDGESTDTQVIDSI